MKLFDILKETGVRDLLVPGSPVFKNFFALSTIQVLNYSLPIITLPYLLRAIGMEQYGHLAFASAFAQYFILLTNYGFNLSATRDVSIYKEDPQRLSRIVTSVLVFRSLLFLVSLAFLAGALSLSTRLHADSAAVILSFGAVAANTISMTWFFQGIERMHYITGLNLLCASLYTVGLFVLVHRPEDWLMIPVLNGAATLTTALMGLVWMRRQCGISITAFSKEEFSRQCRNGWHIFLSNIAINAYSATPTFAIGLFADSRATGIYSIAERLSGVAQTFPLASLLQAIYPRLAALYAGNPARSYRMSRTLQTYTTYAYIAGFPVLLLLSPHLIKLFSGKNYNDAAVTLSLLFLSVVVINSNAFRLQFLLVSGQHAMYARIHVASGIIGGLLTFAGARVLAQNGPPLAITAVNIGVLLLTLRACRGLAHSAAEVAASKEMAYSAEKA